jgi:hypothetical protein
LRLQEDIVHKLQDCRAKHKLLILDHCYSGDVFNRSFQPPSQQPRTDRELVREEAFQAMASCRAGQVALDEGGLIVGHSPFTASLIDGLTRLPANGTPTDPIGTTHLATYVATTFSSAAQRPDCRNLISTDGEFSFFPSATVSFEQFRVNDGDRNLLNAMTSRHGDWWFNERPWFIPGVRSLILQELAESQGVPRGTRTSQHIDEVALKAAAMRAFSRRKGSYGESTRKFFELLESTQGTKDFDQTLETIRDELKDQLPDDDAPTAYSVDKPSLTAEEIHLLALVEHKLLEFDDAKLHYELAEAAYMAQIQGGDTHYRISAAICAADHGELLLDGLSKPLDAAQKFREAEVGIQALTEVGDRDSGDVERASVQRDAGAVVRMTVLCREANSYLRVNRWNDANRLLDAALDLSRIFGADSYFAAQVHRNREWAQISQWQMLSARRSFEASNEVLARLLEEELAELDGRQETDVAAIPPEARSAILSGSPDDIPRADQLHGLSPLTGFRLQAGLPAQSVRDRNGSAFSRGHAQRMRGLPTSGPPRRGDDFRFPTGIARHQRHAYRSTRAAHRHA